MTVRGKNDNLEFFNMVAKIYLGLQENFIVLCIHFF